MSADPKRPGDASLKRPASVLVVVATQAGEVLLMRRTQPVGFWQSITGSLQAGESPRLAAARELAEETGLQAGSRLMSMRQSRLFPIVSAWRSRYRPGHSFNREYWFACILPRRRLIRLNHDEHLAYEWLSIPKALEWASSWTNRDAIRLLAGLPPS